MAHVLLRRAGMPLAAAALLIGMTGPAGAEPPADRGQDRAEPARAASTEDTDGNDGGTKNNVPDEGDNAHPSGKDRSVEAGGSGNQGRAAHDPDDDGNGPDRSNGGLDQPDGPGGEDLADQDGNNGCGNDDDFEDDNEGLCLGRQGAPGAQPAPAVDDVEEGDEDADVDGTVVRPVVPRPAPEQAPVPVVDDEDEFAVLSAGAVRADRLLVADAVTDRPVQAQVLGSSVTRAADANTSPSALARTGAGVLELVLFGLGLVGTGAVVRAAGRPRRTA